ncbi:hypothetical protein RYX36_028009 [Vicia faba]
MSWSRFEISSSPTVVVLEMKFSESFKLPPPLLFRKPPPSTVAKSFSSDEYPVDETFLQTFGPNSKESEDEARKHN